jgi:hypothetical protein
VTIGLALLARGQVVANCIARGLHFGDGFAIGLCRFAMLAVPMIVTVTRMIAVCMLPMRVIVVAVFVRMLLVGGIRSLIVARGLTA